MHRSSQLDPLSHHLLTMALNNAWANHRLLGACCLLGQADFAAPRTGFFPSIQATLNHNLTVDWFYVDAIERCLRQQAPNPEPRRFYTPTEPFAQCTQLLAAQHAVDRRLIDACRSLTVATVRAVVQVPRRAGPVPEHIDRLLAHLFQHQIHHRGQAHAMLAETTVAPPQLDEFFCAHEPAAALEQRSRELVELGIDEAAIWPVAAV
jgi:uncharacterized damage-inducible protein DinB